MRKAQVMITIYVLLAVIAGTIIYLGLITMYFSRINGYVSGLESASSSLSMALDFYNSFNDYGVVTPMAYEAEGELFHGYRYFIGSDAPEGFDGPYFFPFGARFYSYPEQLYVSIERD